MKFLTTVQISLVLSFSVASQAHALQANLPIDEINQILQMKIEKDVQRTLGVNRYFQEVGQKLYPENHQAPYSSDEETFIAPDCLCQMQTRVM